MITLWLTSTEPCLMKSRGWCDPPNSKVLLAASRKKVGNQPRLQDYNIYARRTSNGPVPDFEPYPNQKNSPLGPQKVKNDPKIRSKSKGRISWTIENKSCSTKWIEPKTVFEHYPDPTPTIRPLGPKKVKNDPKIKSKSKVRIDENIENKSSSTTWVNPKTVL